MDIDCLNVVLPSVVSVISVITSATVAICQIKSQKELKTIDLYFKSKFEAYANIHKAYIEVLNDMGENKFHNVRDLQACAEIASMLAKKQTKDAVQKFCLMCINWCMLIEKGKAPDKKSQYEFIAAWQEASDLMRQEMLDYDVTPHKRKKILKK